MDWLPAELRGLVLFALLILAVIALKVFLESRKSRWKKDTGGDQRLTPQARMPERSKLGSMGLRPTAFVKMSGDFAESRADVIAWIKKLSEVYYVVVCIGGGKQINAEFERRGWPIKFGPLGRETETFEQRQAARDALELNEARVQDLFDQQGIVVHVITPVLIVGNVLCHVNGDTMVETVYLGYDRSFVLTLDERVADKRKRFSDRKGVAYPKVEIVGFPEVEL